jgi:flavin reductase (DIM6/NTAB) family NADH-FMN oxidoreductase RutF
MIDSGLYRQVLGHFPTGVTVITSAPTSGPVGMAIGSFVSVSLDPPLVGFFAAVSSSSWPKIEAAGSFCVNVMTAEQLELVKGFASKSEDKFAGVDWRPALSGSPILSGALAFIDCEIYKVVEAGDHWFIMGQVTELGVSGDGQPMVFHRGTYGTFSS